MADTGWLLPGSVFNPSGAPNPWSNPENAQTATDETFAVRIHSKNTATANLRFNDFSFNLPNESIITGVEVRIRKSATGADTVDSSLSLLGASGTSNYADTVTHWPNSPANTDYGGATDLWGTTLTQETVNSSDFGFYFSARPLTGSETELRIYTAWMKVHYSTGDEEPDPEPGDSGAFFMLFSVKDRLREILKPKIGLPELSPPCSGGCTATSTG